MLSHGLASLAGVHRTSVFDRLGAETKADTTTGSKVSWQRGSLSGLDSSCLPWMLFLRSCISPLVGPCTGSPPSQPAPFFAQVAFPFVLCLSVCLSLSLSSPSPNLS